MKGFSTTMAAALAFGLVAASGLVAQTSATTTDSARMATTGDARLDASVAAVSSASVNDPAVMMTKLSLEFNVEASTLDGLLAQGYRPGEIWFALELSKASGKSLSEVVALAQEQSGHGWGLVATELGIKPGSMEFRATVKTMDKKAVNYEGAGKPVAVGTGGSAGSSIAAMGAGGAKGPVAGHSAGADGHVAGGSKH